MLLRLYADSNQSKEVKGMNFNLTLENNGSMASPEFVKRLNDFVNKPMEPLSAEKMKRSLSRWGTSAASSA